MENKKTIAIVGYGYVGKAMDSFFKEDFNILIYDPLVDEYANTQDDINKNADLVIVCVPTPMKKNGEADTRLLEDTFEWLDVELILIKSTVPPLTTKSFQERYPDKSICFSPEYIGEGKYKVPENKNYPDPKDVKKHSFVIIGGEKSEVIGEYFKVVMGDEIIYKYVDSTTAELCKYMVNSFLATKVTFCNEFYEVSERLGVDYDDLREAWLLDGRMGESHTLVFKDNRGFSGKCFPKDVNAINEFSKKMGYDFEVLTAVLKINKNFLEKNENEA